MGLSKTNLFSDEHNRMAELSKAIGHPARVAIIEYLMKKQSCVCGDIVSELPLSQATISQHLKALKSVGIIHGEVDGAYRCYCLNPEVIKFFKERINTFFNIKLKCC